MGTPDDPNAPLRGLNRREFGLYLALLATCRSQQQIATGTGQLGSPNSTRGVPTPAVRIADVHTHLFNANFLPLDGIFAKWVSGTVAGIVATILGSHVDQCGSSGGLAAAGATDPLAEIETADPQTLIDRLYDRTSAGVLSSVNPEEQKPLSREQFTAMFNQTAEGAKSEFPDKGGFLQWITLMTWCERKIWSAVQHAYPDVELFVAHMMDMENYYKPSKPKYDWPDEQLQRMAALVKEAEGKLLTFVAFDPKRDDWKAIIDAGLASGCAGVKFYPPNGYPAFDVTKNEIPPHTAALLRYCLAKDLPVFSHTTTQGFESIRGYGLKYANPKLWRRVLEQKEFTNLRLCFGHAGGEEGWFPDGGRQRPGAPAPFATEVIALCKEFPNVYCEVAYLEPILTSTGQARFQQALAAAVGTPGKYDFSKKIMYGSDWHMIHKVRDHRAYLPSFRTALSGHKWDTLRADFFLRNAVRWLNLQNYVQRAQTTHQGVLTQAGVERLSELAKLATVSG